MLELGYIYQGAYDKAIKTPLNASYHDLKTEVKAPYVAELVRTQLEQMYGDNIYTDGFQVFTTLNSELQAAAQTAVVDNLIAYDQRHGYRGAENNLGSPSFASMPKWEEELRKLRPINNLEPGAVVEMTDQTATVLRADGNLTIIPWSGLSWARQQLNADYLGPLPSRARQIVKLGDVVRIMPTEEGSYHLAQLPKAEAGLVALNPQNGAILALVGGFDYHTSKFNRITSAKRQPGSSFKPFIYSAALEKGYTLSTIINDAPIVIENPNDNSLWRPQNVNHKFYGPTRLRTAIIESRNLVSIRLLALMGVPYTIDYLKKFGFVPNQLPPGLSLALGTALVTPLQMAQAFAVFANHGLKVVPFVIDNIRNSQNEIIYQARPLVACRSNCSRVSAAPRVLSEQNAFLINSALHDVIERGTAKLAKNLGRNDLCGKTGTTQNQVDAWFAGYNPDIVAVTWMGFDQPQSLHEYGSKSALPLWMQFIQTALRDKPEKTIEQPVGIVSARINSYTGQRTSPRDSNGIFEYFMTPYLPSGEGEGELTRAAVEENDMDELSPTEDSNPEDLY